jgi:hypothetical protein
MNELPFAAVKAGLTLLVLAVIIIALLVDQRRNRPEPRPTSEVPSHREGKAGENPPKL